jgi:ribose transport system permease protein
MNLFRRKGSGPLQRRLVALMPYAILGLMILAFYILPSMSGRETTSFNVFNSIQTFADLGLLALALGITMIAGEFDLSILGMFALGAMVSVKTGVSSPVLGIVVALATGALAGAVQGGIIARLKMNSMTVTLGGYLILLGITGVLGHAKNVQYTNFGVGASLNEHIATVLSPRSLIVIGIFLLVYLVLRLTRVGTDVRAVGGERRASRTAGVPVNFYVVGVFVVSGMIAGLAGALHGYSVATAAPDPGLAPLVFAITATLLGGISLAGGRGSILGIAAGVLTLSLLQEFFAIQATPEYVSSIVTGGLLVLVAVIAAPDLIRYWKAVRPSGGGRSSGVPLPPVAAGVPVVGAVEPNQTVPTGKEAR